MGWNKVWIVPFYLVDFVVFVGVLFCLIYFLKYRRSPLVKASHSNVDNGILIILCIFCLLPIIHFGEISSVKCLSQWLVQNVMYAIYCGLLFTKRPYFGNTRRRIACEQAHHINEEQSPTLRARQEHKYLYPALFAMLPVVITMATVPFSVNHEVNMPACPSRVDLCPIQENLSVFTSMAYTWSLLLSLSVLTLTENINGDKKSWKVPWLILVGFLSYTALVCFSYLKLPCSHASWFNFVVYLLILINPVICLVTLYLPRLHLITTCWLHLKRFQKSSGSKGSSHQEFSTDQEIIVNHSHHAGCHEGSNARLHAGPHASTDLASARPVSTASDASRMLNIQKSIQIVSNLFRTKEPEYQLLRQQSLYDNVPEPLITWDNISQSSLATALTSDVDGQSIGENEGSLELAEITLGELREMTEFLKGLKSSDV